MFAYVHNADHSWDLVEHETDEAPTGYHAVAIPGYYAGGAGASWDEASETWIDVPPAETAPLLTIVEFMLLFTVAEWIAIKAARASDPVLDYYWDLMTAATDGLRLDHPSLVAGVAYVMAHGFIDEARQAEILAGTPPA